MIDLQKKYFLVIDTETCNTIEQPFCYDVGYAICDREGQIYLERSFVVAEMFLDNKDLMQSAYYANKLPQYWEDIKQQKRIVKSIFNIRKQIVADMKEYHVTEVGAYNMLFDKRALNNTIRYCSKSLIRWFFPLTTKYFCIWNMACDAILAKRNYIKFALANGLVSQAQNIKTSAEACYQYLTNKLDFEESHTGLEDVRIEVAILAECYKKHQKLEKEPKPNCWQKVQKKRKELKLSA